MNKFIEHDIVQFGNTIGIFSRYTSEGFCVVDSIGEEGIGSPTELHSSVLKKIGRLPMNSRGRLTTIVGPMSSGKTLELIRKLTINKIQGKKIIVAKHNIDTRDIKNPDSINNIKVQSRLGIEYNAISFPSAGHLNAYVNNIIPEQNIDVIGVEEGQFWDQNLLTAIDSFTSKGIDVIVTGLNQNFKGNPFGLIPDLMALSDELILLSGVCAVCKGNATKTQRLINDEPAPKSSPDVLVGAEEGYERYECRCPDCWVEPE